jgi:hypothetical protein
VRLASLLVTIFGGLNPLSKLCLWGAWIKFPSVRDVSVIVSEWALRCRWCGGDANRNDCLRSMVLFAENLAASRINLIKKQRHNNNSSRVYYHKPHLFFNSSQAQFTATTLKQNTVDQMDRLIWRSSTMLSDISIANKWKWQFQRPFSLSFIICMTCSNCEPNKNIILQLR